MSLRRLPSETWITICLYLATDDRLTSRTISRARLVFGVRASASPRSSMRSSAVASSSSGSCPRRMSMTAPWVFGILTPLSCIHCLNLTRPEALSTIPSVSSFNSAFWRSVSSSASLIAMCTKAMSHVMPRAFMRRSICQNSSSRGGSSRRTEDSPRSARTS